MLRNLLRRSPTSKLIAGTPQIGLLASQIIAETATGDQGPGLLYDDALANTGKQLRAKITSWSGTAGTLFVYENGSILIEGQADGSYVIGYDREAWASDGSVSVISDTATVTIGSVNASVSAGEGISTGSGTGGDATATTSANAGSGEGVGVGSGTGGDAFGAAAGDGYAEAGEGVSTGSGSGGTASAGSGTFTGSLSDEDIARIAAAVLAALNATTIPVDAKKMNGAPIIGTGQAGDNWRGFGVQP